MRALYIPSHARRDQAAETALRIATGGRPWLHGHVWPVQATTVLGAAAELSARGVPIAVTSTVGWAIVQIDQAVRQ